MIRQEETQRRTPPPMWWGLEVHNQSGTIKSQILMAHILHLHPKRVNGSCLCRETLSVVVHGGNQRQSGCDGKPLRVAPLALCRETRPPQWLTIYKAPLRPQYLTTATASAIQTKPAYAGYKP